MIHEEQHDTATFQDVLADYLDTYKIELPSSIQEIIVKKFFKPDDVFRPVCALQYGDYILCVPQKNLSNLRGFLYWDVRYAQIKKVLINTSGLER